MRTNGKFASVVAARNKIEERRAADDPDENLDKDLVEDSEDPLVRIGGRGGAFLERTRKPWKGG